MNQLRQTEYGAQEQANAFSDASPMEMYPSGMQQRLFGRLMADERYADLDKAKHNPGYLNYLMENYEEDLPF